MHSASTIFMEERLRASGLDPATPAAIGIRPVPRGFEISYIDPATGKPMLTPTGTPYTRTRYMPPLPVGRDGRPVKYATPKGGGTHAYILGAVHRHLNGDGMVMILTEGELKAAAGVGHKLPVIGLPGITCWCESRATREDSLDLLPEIERYLRPNRDVVLVYDSDARDRDGGMRPQFRANARRLSKALAKFQTRLFVLTLPQIEGQEKTGLDDYLLVHTAKDFRELLDEPRDPVQPYEEGVSAVDLTAAELPPVRWIVEPVLPEGLALLVGKSKLGKSWLALDMAVAVASGGIVASTWRCPPGNVLYAALEDNPRRMQSRLKAVLRGEPSPERLSFWFDLPVGGRAFDRMVESLSDWLSGHPEARLVIIDTLGRVLPPAKRGSDPYRDDTASMATLQRLAIDRRVAIVGVHHARKGEAEDAFDAVLGPTALMGVADTTMLLRRSRKADVAELLVTGRDVTEQHLALSFRDGLWRVEGDAAEVAVSAARAAVLAALRQVPGPMRLTELADAIGRDKGNTSKLVAAMTGDGLVAKDGDGRITMTPAREW